MMKINNYEVLGELPNPFIFDNGERLTDKSQWFLRRREIYKSVIELQYGKMLPKPEFLHVECNFYIDKTVLSCTIVTGTKKNPIRMQMMVMKPEGFGPFPAVIDGDLCFRYPYDKDFIHTFTDNGIMLVLFNRTELVPDRKEVGRTQGQVYKTYPQENYGALAAWAWGYSRCVDALEQLNLVDKNCIVFTGHSRGAKTAVLAGAIDERATIVNPNSTCAGGCGCYRIHMSADTEDNYEVRSETLEDLIREYDFWMGPELKQYRDKEQDLPFDAHFLKAMIAPRVFYDSEAISDIWANPIGSWQTTMAAKEVYKFLDVPQNIYWSFRKGYHEHRVEDVKRLVNLIKHHTKGEPLSDDFFKLPFEEKELIFDWKSPTSK